MSTHPAASPEAVAKRKATMAAKREVREAERGYPIPLILTCHVTGKVVKYTVPGYIEKCIAKAGSLQALIDGYVSREGQKQVAQVTDAAQVSSAPDQI